MPVKRGAAGGRASSSKKIPNLEPTRDELQRFVNAEAKRRFELYIKDRNVHHEKGFIFKNDGNFGLLKEVAAVIKMHGWRSFAIHPINPVIPLVREFYAKIITGA